MKINGNEIAFKTFSCWRLMKAEIQVPKIGKDLIPMEASEKNPVRHLKEFEKIKYGISQDALELGIEDM